MPSLVKIHLYLLKLLFRNENMDERQTHGQTKDDQCETKIPHHYRVVEYENDKTNRSTKIIQSSKTAWSAMFTQACWFKLNTCICNDDELVVYVPFNII